MKMRINDLVKIASLFVLFGFAIVSCEKDPFDAPLSTNNNEIVSTDNTVGLKSATIAPQVCGVPVSVDLLAGQTTNIGNVTVANDEDFVYVTFNAKNGWFIRATHLYVGALSKAPLNKAGNPMIGNFPLSKTHTPNVTSFTYSIPMADLEQSFIVAAHADVVLLNNLGEVVRQETAWGAGKQFAMKGSWASYSEHSKQQCVRCVYIPQVFDLFGGQTIKVGNLTVVNDATNLYVTYNTTGNFYIRATHLYVGLLGGLPVNNSSTPVPGQFPYNLSYTPAVQTYTYTIPLSGLPSCYIVAAHADVAEVVNGTTVRTETAWSFGERFPNTNRWGWYSPYCTQVCSR